MKTLTIILTNNATFTITLQSNVAASDYVRAVARVGFIWNGPVAYPLSMVQSVSVS